MEPRPLFERLVAFPGWGRAALLILIVSVVTALLLLLLGYLIVPRPAMGRLNVKLPAENSPTGWC
jgi:hypothetical protein